MSKKYEYDLSGEVKVLIIIQIILQSDVHQVCGINFYLPSFVKMIKI